MESFIKEITQGGYIWLELKLTKTQENKHVLHTTYKLHPMLKISSTRPDTLIFIQIFQDLRLTFPYGKIELR